MYYSPEEDEDDDDDDHMINPEGDDDEEEEKKEEKGDTDLAGSAECDGGKSQVEDFQTGSEDGGAEAEEKNKKRRKPRRERGKARRFAEIYDELPGEVRSKFEALPTRAEQTKFINNAFTKTKKGGKLQAKSEVLYHHEKVRTDGHQNSEGMQGMIVEEAIARVGGSKEALLAAISQGRIIKRMIGELDVYVFPKFEYAHTSGFQEKVGNERRKSGDPDALQDDSKMGFKWKPMEMFEGGESQSHIPLCFPGMTPDSEASADAGSLAMGTDSKPTPDEIKELATHLTDLNKSGATALKALQQGEAMMEKKKLSAGEAELVEQTLASLRSAAVLPVQAEKLSLPMGKAVKFNKISLEGGWTSTNVKVLVSQASDLIGKLATCVRLVRAVVPVGKAP